MRTITKPVLLACLCTLASAPLHAQQTVAGGIYTDRPSYLAGEMITVHGAAPNNANIYVILSKATDPLVEIARSASLAAPPLVVPFGSFVDFPTVTLDGRSEFTLEGWFLPTLVGGDVVVVAGQASATDSSAAIYVDDQGRWAGGVRLDSGATASVTGSAPTALGEWYHLALVFDGVTSQTLTLYVDGVGVGSDAAAGTVATSGLNFRIGARAEAPADLAGVVDGRVDAWAVWPSALTASDIGDRILAGTTQVDPIPPASAVDLYVGFDDAYGATVTDASLNNHVGTIVNHGEPLLAGVSGLGASLGLYHGQLVDAQMPVVAQLSIPAGTGTGLYVVAVVNAATDEVLTQPLVTPSIVIRPDQPTPGTRVALVVSTGTWQAYNTWPGQLDNGAIDVLTPRTRHPSLTEEFGGGNNSVYTSRGDGFTPGKFSGWRRPNKEASIYEADGSGFARRAIQSFHMTKWLDAEGWIYDTYSDHDFESGASPLVGGDYSVVIFHGHHEYWSRTEIEATYAFQAAGGSVLSLGGNTVGHRTVYADDIIEVRKVPKPDASYRDGLDAYSAIDGDILGAWGIVTSCEQGDAGHVLGSALQSNFQPPDAPLNFGRWVSEAQDHWLWSDGGVSDGTVFGDAPGGIGAVGHEADAWNPGIVPRGLVGEVVVLADATSLPFFDSTLIQHRDELEPVWPSDPATCDDFYNDAAYRQSIAGALFGAKRVMEVGESAGHVLYWRHEGGGHVLNVASVITPWALGNDAVLDGLVTRALECFANDAGCGDGVLPNTDGAPTGTGDSDAALDGGPVSTGDDSAGGDAGTDNTGAPPSGCGCGSSSQGGLWAMVVLFALARRRLRVHSISQPSESSSSIKRSF